MELLINDNQFVKRETLAVLDHRDYQARYDQARSVVSLKKLHWVYNNKMKSLHGRQLLKQIVV